MTCNELGQECNCGAIANDTNISSENFCRKNWQTACFGGAMIFWTSLADAPRKMTPEVLIFSSLRLLAEGKSGTTHFWSRLLAKNDFHKKSDLRYYEIMIFSSVLA